MRGGNKSSVPGELFKLDQNEDCHPSALLKSRLAEMASFDLKSSLSCLLIMSSRQRDAFLKKIKEIEIFCYCILILSVAE